MTIEPGQRFRLLTDHGNPPLHVRAGSIGTVREVVSADVLGAHNDYEDAVVLEFEDHSVTYEEGEPAIAASRRAVAFAQADLSDGALFEDAG